ncbi:MAG: response regulator transcription factor [Acholeplasmatales bacterium]|nr:response regulator transcription factor [Acholeplasmatales bacterium]
MAYKILIVDDDKDLSFIISETLKKYSFIPTAAYSAEMAYDLLEKNTYNIVILDINLPDSSGFEICKEIRKMSKVPIIFASARSSVTDKVDGLDMGGDFYLSKPYTLKELVATVNALVRRCYGSEDRIIEFGNIKINIDSRTVYRNNQLVQLSLKEFDLLSYMAQNQNKALKKETLLSEVWGTFSTVELQTLTVHIRWLREKLEDDPANPIYIKTVRSVGYMLEISEA